MGTINPNPLASFPNEFSNTAPSLNATTTVSVPPRLGYLPIEIGNLTEMQILILENNQLSGPIPTEIGYLENLEVLQLGMCRFC